MRAVILAGGKGTRLAPYTAVLPKPLMPIGDMPILEVVLRQLKVAGITRVTMAVGYLAELMRAFFGDGGRFGLCIDYSMEEEPLGTVGPLTLIDGLDEPFLVMNGDTLTTLDYRLLIEHHRASGALLTIGTHVREVKIDFGVIESGPTGLVTQYVEKPTLDYRVSMGIYVFQPEALSYLRKGERRDLPDLVKTLLGENKPVSTYSFSGYWLDMGRPDDYARAIEEFAARRTEFIPEEA
ncbi:MAG: sugar phosphate nucleotidyltransferase [Rhodocyclaceae bacterium]|nr:sugar phosphate nucleotidyltransferase [Rhodocyclaceae bacterium]